MSKEVKRPFEATKEFIRKRYNESYVGDVLPTNESEGIYPSAKYLDFGGKGNINSLLVSMPIGQKPGSETPLGVRRSNSALLYVFGDQNQAEIAGEYGIDDQLVSRDVSINITEIQRTASQDLQVESPRCRMSTYKPRHELAARSVSGKIRPPAAVMQAIREGKGTSTTALRPLFDPSVLSNANMYFVKNGLPTLEIYVGKIEKVIPEILDEKTSMERLREIIKLFDNHGNYSHYAHRKDPLLISISSLQGEAWGSKNFKETKTAIKFLIKAGIPVGVAPAGRKYKGKEVRHVFTFTRYKDMALEVLATAPDHLKKKLVTQVYGPPVYPVPNTNAFVGTRKAEHRNVVAVLKGIGLNIRPKNEIVANKLAKAKFPVWNLKGELFISKGSEKSFRKLFSDLVGKSPDLT